MELVTVVLALQAANHQVLLVPVSFANLVRLLMAAMYANRVMLARFRQAPVPLNARLVPAVWKPTKHELNASNASLDQQRTSLAVALRVLETCTAQSQGVATVLRVQQEVNPTRIIPSVNLARWAHSPVLMMCVAGAAQVQFQSSQEPQDVTHVHVDKTPMNSVHVVFLVKQITTEALTIENVWNVLLLHTPAKEVVDVFSQP